MVPEEDPIDDDAVYEFNVDMYELCKRLDDNGINYCDLVAALLDGNAYDSYDRIFEIYQHFEYELEHKKTMKKTLQVIPVVSSIFFYV
jgi:hypothetical protein